MGLFRAKHKGRQPTNRYSKKSFLTGPKFLERPPAIRGLDPTAYAGLSSLRLAEVAALLCCCALLIPPVEVSPIEQDMGLAGICRFEERGLYLAFDEWPRRNLRSIDGSFGPSRNKGLPKCQATRPVGRASSRKRRQFVDSRRSQSKAGGCELTFNGQGSRL